MHPRRTAPYVIVAIASMIACALMALCVLQLLQSRDDAMERARETSRNLGLVAERDIERNSSCTTCLCRPSSMGCSAAM